LMVCTYGGEALWQPFADAMARAERLPVALDLNSKTFADPVHAGAIALGTLDRAIAALADESDPTQIIRIGTAATYVDRLEGCREALWRVVRDARQGGAVASGILPLLMLANDALQTGRWDEARHLIDEAIELCNTHGYQNVIWPCRFQQAVLAAARGNDDRVKELCDQLVQWAGPRGNRPGLCRAWQAR